MALIECPDCKKPISDKAPSCPTCGFPVAQELKKEEHKIKGYKVSNMNRKSPGTAVLLAFIFGPFGTFYASVGTGIVMCVIYALSLIGSIPGLMIASVVNMAVCYFFVQEHNEKILHECAGDNKAEEVNPGW